MTISADAAVAALNLRFLLDHPREAARKMESLPAADVAELLAAQPSHALVPVWQCLASDTELAVLPYLPDSLLRFLLTELEPAHSAAVLSRLERDKRDVYLALLDPQVAQEIRTLMAYPPDTAGEMMDPRVSSFRDEVTVEEALARLRVAKRRGLREIFLIDDDGRLSGRVFIQDLALAEPDQPLGVLRLAIAAAAQDTAPREEVVALMSAVQEETLVDIQTMVGASRDEGALSKTTFAVVKRLPWLQINLLTAFLAAAVVGLFESTIAKFTALAVLMPVVAGQSGNAGAQALAVTMRGLVLREISPRHWPKVVFKEINVGLLNGLGIAVTTALGVYVWSRSLGLVVVISLSMVISMIVAGFAGALVPIMLRRLGQDPAQSSSIILTTVTDVVGFSSFLGIATLLASLLEQTLPK